jgi:hypothetical protein
VTEAEERSGTIRVRDLGPIDLKGKTESVAAFELLDVETGPR